MNKRVIVVGGGLAGLACTIRLAEQGLDVDLFSMVPVIGSAAVWVPAAIILIISGHWGKGLILLAWGAAVVGQADNVVRPYVISQRSNMHPLLVFFTLLGGVQAFGVMGIFVGPVILSVAIVVFDMLRETFRQGPEP